MQEHLARNVVVEFLKFFVDVEQEGIAGPATNRHDEQDGTSSEKHCHSCFQCVAMWRTSSPIAETASCNTFVIWLELMCLMQLYFLMADIGVLSLDPP
jgi:hypothetical protein